MIRFLINGLLRDRARSLLPLLVVTIGVMLTVFARGYINGIMVDMIEQTAKFNTGHVKVTTAAYAENMAQMPNDLAIMGADELIQSLRSTFTDMDWEKRIKFGGLVDVPDATGETQAQGPAIGMALDLLSPESKEISRLKIEQSLVKGHLPAQAGEALLSDQFAENLHIQTGDRFTLIGSTMNGSMSFYNFTLAGTVQFGNSALDRGSLIADISDVQWALDMPDAVSEMVGFFHSGFYTDEEATAMLNEFNETYLDEADEFGPVLLRLRDQEGLAMYVDLVGSMAAIISFVFILAMSLVLWNAGLMTGLRRYGEIGVRIAIGEEKGHVYRMMIAEAVLIGIVGTIIGTSAGLSLSWLLQTYGLDISDFTKNATTGIMMPNIMRARITPGDFYIGFVPGVFATLIGTMLAGIGIYKRKTASLFKELEQ